MILNLGGGKLPIEGAVTVDLRTDVNAEVVCDLTKIPWPWADNSIEGIYIIHCLEHFADTYSILRECDRVLMKGGFLHIQVPHSSNPTGIGDLGHYRTFNYYTLGDYLCMPHYIFKTPLFKQEYCKLRWWVTTRNKNKYVPFRDPAPKPAAFTKYLVNPVSCVIQFFIDLSPRCFERLWCGLVGGADEIIWRGTKL